MVWSSLEAFSIDSSKMDFIKENRADEPNRDLPSNAASISAKQTQF